MYAKSKELKRRIPVRYQCQDCEEFFTARASAQACPSCGSHDKSNLIVLHMEDDIETTEWLELVDFSAGD